MQTASCTSYRKKRAAHNSKIYIYKVLVKSINKHGLESARQHTSYSREKSVLWEVEYLKIYCEQTFKECCPAHKVSKPRNSAADTVLFAGTVLKAGSTVLPYLGKNFTVPPRAGACSLRARRQRNSCWDLAWRPSHFQLTLKIFH